MFFKKKRDNKNDFLIKICALLIHAAKIDENYSEQERKIIKKTLLELGLKNEELDNIFKKSEEVEKNSNQILEFTKEVKNKDEEFKIEIKRIPIIPINLLLSRIFDLVELATFRTFPLNGKIA